MALGGSVAGAMAFGSPMHSMRNMRNFTRDSKISRYFTISMIAACVDIKLLPRVRFKLCMLRMLCIARPISGGVCLAAAAVSVRFRTMVKAGLKTGYHRR